jgi:hypothetical protein
MTAKEKSDYTLCLDLRQKGIIKTPREPFELSDTKEFNSLIVYKVFKFKVYDLKKHRGKRIFNSRVVHKIKDQNTNLYKKSRLVI